VSDARDRAHFNRWSSTYEESRIQKYLDRLHELMLDQAAWNGAPRHLIDVGCGTGRLLRQAAARWPAAVLTGLDPAGGMLAVARRLTPGASFQIARAAQLPIAAGTADVAVSSASLHHWSDPVAGLREIARVLCPGGRFVLADIAVPRWLAWLVRSRAHTGEDLVRLVAEAGFRIVGGRRLFAGLMLVVTADKPAAA